MTNSFPGQEDFSFLEILFTCVSAFATVGFDIGVTQNLGYLGQFVLVVGMFVGRLGILLLLSAIWEIFNKSSRKFQNRIGYPQEDFYV